MVVNDKEITLHDDTVSGTGNCIEINQRAFQRARIHVSNDLSLIDLGLLSFMLQRFRVFLILIEFLSDVTRR